MSSRTRLAERTVLTICAQLSVAVFRDPHFLMWLKILHELLPECKECSTELRPIVTACEALVCASCNDSQSRALTELRATVAEYFTTISSARYDEFKAAQRLERV